MFPELTLSVLILRFAYFEGSRTIIGNGDGKALSVVPVVAAELSINIPLVSMVSTI